MRICAGMVLHNPDKEKLRRNIAAVENQVESLVMVDNCSENWDEIQSLIALTRVKTIRNKKNIGIAGALNQLINQAYMMGFDWVLTLDQDSVVCENLIQILSPLSYQYQRAAVICPYVVDINQTSLEEYKNLSLQPIENVKFCITSGALTNISMARAVGGFNTMLFIDHVDHDFCLRLRQNNYEIIRANTAYILHEIGRVEAVVLFPRLGRIIRWKWLYRPKYISNHSSIRVYYQSRNLIFILRKYGKLFVPHPLRYWISWCKSMVLKLLYEDEKIKKCMLFISGSWEGLMMDIKD